MDVQMPDGTIIQGVPDGTTRAQLQAKYSAHLSATEKVDPTGSTLQNIAAGAGEEIMRPALGLKQMNAGVADAAEKFSTGKSDFSRSKAVEREIADTKELTAPLNATKAGMVGRVLGGATLAAGAGLIPGANSAAGAAITGAVLGGLQPTDPGESRAANVALGAAGGAVGQKIGNAAGAAISKKMVQATAGVEARNAATAPARAAAATFQDAGYIRPPSQAKPSVWNRLMEGYAGKIQTAQSASLKNQPVTNRLIKQGLGVPEDQQLSVGVLDSVRRNAGKAYEAVKSIGTLQATPRYQRDIEGLASEYRSLQQAFPNTAKNPDIDGLIQDLNKSEMSAADAVNMVKLLRKKATGNIRAWNDEGKQALGFAQRKAADALDKLVEDNLRQSGRTDLFRAYRDARQVIAKSHDVEAALNDATGDVDARKLGEMLKKRPLTGELRTVALFAKGNPKAAQVPDKIGSHPGFSPLDAAAAATAAVASPHTAPAKLAEIAGLIAGRPLARALITSRPYQKAMVTQAAEKVPMRVRIPHRLADIKAIRNAIAPGSAELVVGVDPRQE